MGKQNHQGQASKIETVGVVEIPALADPLAEEVLGLNEIRRRCGFAVRGQCKTCNHPQRAEIEQALMTESLGTVSKRYGIGKEALRRHMQHHFQVPE